jgi:hypothetical protein
MDRRKFLMGLGILPFVSTSLFSNKSENIKKEYILVGLGDSGDTLTRKVQEMGFKGRVFDIQVGKADNLHIRLTESLLHGEEIATKPNFLFSTFTKQKNFVPVFVSGLGGIRSTYLAALTHHEMTKSGRHFHMFLTTPFEFEGSLRNTRAKKFQLAMEGDQRIKYINLNDSPRGLCPTIKEIFENFPPAVVYKKINQLMT